MLEARVVPYNQSFTYDIFPASETGSYFAGGVPIGSTLGRSDTASAMSLSDEASGRPASLVLGPQVR